MTTFGRPLANWMNSSTQPAGTPTSKSFVFLNSARGNTWKTVLEVGVVLRYAEPASAAAPGS